MCKKHNMLCEMISPFSRYQCISEEILSSALKFSIDPGVGECFWGKSVTIANDRDSVKHARLTLLPNSHKYTINFHNAIRCTAQLQALASRSAMRHNVLGTHVIVMPDIGQGQDTRAGENLPTLDLGYLNISFYQNIISPSPGLSWQLPIFCSLLLGSYMQERLLFTPDKNLWHLIVFTIQFFFFFFPALPSGDLGEAGRGRKGLLLMRTKRGMALAHCSAFAFAFVNGSALPLPCLCFSFASNHRLFRFFSFLG